MKHILFSILLLTSLILSKPTLANGFEGTITMSMHVEKSDGSNPALESMLNSPTVTYIKGNKHRVEQTGPMGTTVSITDMDKHESIMLLNLPGKKIAVKTTLSSDPNSSEKFQSDFTIKYTDDTKVIAGYECHKAIMTSNTKSNGFEMEIWYCDDLPNTSSEYPMVNGALMEFTSKTGGMEVKFTVTAITPGPVDDALFEIPEGYEVITQDQLRSIYPMMGSDK